MLSGCSRRSPWEQRKDLSEYTNTKGHRRDSVSKLRQAPYRPRIRHGAGHEGPNRCSPLPRRRFVSHIHRHTSRPSDMPQALTPRASTVAGTDGPGAARVCVPWPGVAQCHPASPSHPRAAADAPATAFSCSHAYATSPAPPPLNHPSRPPLLADQPPPLIAHFLSDAPAALRSLGARAKNPPRPSSISSLCTLIHKRQDHAPINAHPTFTL